MCGDRQMYGAHTGLAAGCTDGGAATRPTHQGALPDTTLFLRGGVQDNTMAAHAGPFENVPVASTALNGEIADMTTHLPRSGLRLVAASSQVRPNIWTHR
jgi:hypothetical protein